MNKINDQFGNIDIYLFDQIQKNRILPHMKILDAGCGSGRNIYFFMREGFSVFAVDQNSEAIQQIKDLARDISPDLPQNNFQTAQIEDMPFSDNFFDFIISNAVLHFAENQTQFDKMMSEVWRTLKPDGIFFARLASSIGLKDLIIPTHDGKFILPDGSERFLVDEETLFEIAENLKAEFLEPLKTTNVQNLRCMTTLVLQKK